MYDQVGFYSDNGFARAQARHLAVARRVAAPTWISMVSIFPNVQADAQAEAQRGKRTDGGAGGGSFKDIFSQFFRGDRRRQAGPMLSPKKAPTSNTG